MENSQFYEDMLAKIGSLNVDYGGCLSFEEIIGRTRDVYKFPVTLPEQIAPILAGVGRRYRADQPIRVELSYFWEDQLTSQRGLRTHLRLFTVAEAIGRDILRLIQPEQSYIRIISLASIRVIIYKGDELEVDEDYDCECEMCCDLYDSFAV